MATLARATFTSMATEFRIVTRPWLLLWLAAAGAVTAALVLLTIAISDSPVPSLDRTVLDWVVGRDVPLLAGFMHGISGLTSNFPAMGMGIAGIAFLWLVGLTRGALAFAIVGGTVGVVAFAGDLTLGEIVGRSRPLMEESETSFPSGHVFGSTVFFGFWGFLAVYYRLNRRILIPLVGLFIAVILAVGFARMFEQAHWPSDVAAGYLLGGLWLLLLIPFFIQFQRLSWLSSPKQATELDVLPCETCRIEKSIASTVVLDPEQGTATKVYRPPGVVRLIYWLAFQARFPYEHNVAALDAATYRRKIASALTINRFGKDLVAHVTGVTCGYGPCSFVTEFIPGEKVKNDDGAKEFLGQVAETFAEAGLSVWQVNPRNPHAHTNLIRTPEGDAIIIDLESAIATPIPAPGQWLSALRRGTIPVFDDIDFERLRDYITANEAAFDESLGRDGLVELRDNADRCEQAIRIWQDSEPRIWGRLISGLYRLMDWKRFSMGLAQSIDGTGRPGRGAFPVCGRQSLGGRRPAVPIGDRISALPSIIGRGPRPSSPHGGAPSPECRVNASDSRLAESGPLRVDANILGQGQAPSTRRFRYGGKGHQDSHPAGHGAIPHTRVRGGCLHGILPSTPKTPGPSNVGPNCH